MQNKDNKKLMWVLYIGAMLATIVLVGLFFVYRYKVKFHPYPYSDEGCIVLLGDSNVAITRFEEAPEEYISKIVGREVYNCALGGTTAAKLDYEKTPDYYYDRCCFYNIVNMIISEEKGVLLDNPEWINSQYVDAVERVERLAAVDFSKVDIVCITYGVNDYYTGVSFDNFDNEWDYYTFGGALRQGIEKLHARYPDIKFILTGPTFCYVQTAEGDVPAVNYNNGGGYLDQYSETLCKIADKYDYVYYIDMYDRIELDETNYTEAMLDIVHMDGTRQKNFCGCLAEYILEVMND